MRKHLPTWFSALDRKVGFRMLTRYPGLTVVGLTACAVPVGRALRIHPTEALRAEG